MTKLTATNRIHYASGVFTRNMAWWRNNGGTRGSFVVTDADMNILVRANNRDSVLKHLDALEKKAIKAAKKAA